MHKSDDSAVWEYDEYIASALRTEGGHLSIGRGGFTLYYSGGARLSGCDCEQVKACCIAAGLPVIDSRMVAFEASFASRCAVRWSRLGRNRARRPTTLSPMPPLVAVASVYRSAGAEVFNIGDCAPLPATQGE
jgi:hypothetical protein